MRVRERRDRRRSERQGEIRQQQQHGQSDVRQRAPQAPLAEAVEREQRFERPENGAADDQQQDATRFGKEEVHARNEDRGDADDGDDDRLGNALQPDQARERRGENQNRRDVDDRAARQDVDRAGDRSGRGRGDAVHECFEPRVVGEARVERRGDDDEQVARQEDAERREHRAAEALHEIADERDGDDHRAGRDHGHRDGVEELLIGEPAVLAHHAAVEKRHDGQAAAEDERARLGEEPEERRAARRGCRCRCGERRSAARSTAARGARRAHRLLHRASVAMPQPRISETTSASSTAVAIAFAAKITHSSQSRPSVSRTSLYALRRMMAMTAAPMP